MYVVKRDRDVRCFSDHVVSCLGSPSIYAHNKGNIVLQYCYCAVTMGEEKYVYTK